MTSKRRKLVLGVETVKTMVTEVPVGRLQDIGGAMRRRNTDTQCTEEETGCSIVSNGF